jgi:hypothetical protein
MAALLSGAVAAAQPANEPARQPVGGNVARFAVVIGNNVPDTGRVATLRYADDDAVATHRLLTDAGVESRLLVRLDATSARLYAGTERHGTPSWSALTAALADLDRRMARARARGQRAELLFFYSGHGDVANGEGYIVLEDRRLTRTLLYEAVLARSQAHSNHVIVDACKSYFLAFEKGPGGQRERYRGNFARTAVPARLANTGFLLSTSSDGDSHEWERYQAGVFSHEVRSGLRGAADVDRDGHITYAELGAFLMTANQGIANPRYRPDFSVHPPGLPPGELSRGLLSWEAAQQALLIDRPDIGHVYLEGPTGERLADAHVATDQVVALYLPDERPLFLRNDDDAREYVVQAEGPVRVSWLAAAVPSVARKGALHLAFERLFEKPFGAAEVEAFEHRFRAHATRPVATEPPVMDPPEGNPDDQPDDRLGEPGDQPDDQSNDQPDDQPEPHAGARPGAGRAAHRAPGAGVRARVQTIAGWTAVGTGALGLAAGVAATERYYGGRDASHRERLQRNQQIRTWTATSLVLGSVAGAAAATWLTAVLWPDDHADHAGAARRHPTRLTLVPSAGPAAGGFALWFETAW